MGEGGFAGELRGQKAVNESRGRAQVARLGNKRLQFAFGRKNAVELDKAQTSHAVGEGRRADYPDLGASGPGEVSQPDDAPPAGERVSSFHHELQRHSRRLLADTALSRQRAEAAD